MGFFRFRRSVRLFPGVRLNLGKRSASVSIGGRGAHVTLGGPQGTRTTVGIPGTGLSYTATEGDAKDPPAPTGEASAPARAWWPWLLVLAAIAGVVVVLLR